MTRSDTRMAKTPHSVSARGRGRTAALACLSALAWSSAALAQEDVAPPPPPEASPWYEALSLGAFIDAYARVNSNFPKPERATSVLGPSAASSGAGLSWVGLDASYAPAPVGGTLNLRFGPSAKSYAGSDAEHGLEMVKQAFAAWRPARALELDFGKFDGIFGTELADSQANFNYTRGALYWLAQPNFTTGLRARYDVTDGLDLTALVVNGWNVTLDDNTGKSFALSLGLAPTDTLSIRLGWMGGPEQPDSATIDCAPGTAYDPSAGSCVGAAGAPGGTVTVDRGEANQLAAWRHLVDLAVRWSPTPALGLALNADYGTQGRRDPSHGSSAITRQTWYGASLMGRYQLSPVWGVALRGEALHDRNDFFGTGLDQSSFVTGTLTLEAKPSDNLIIRLDARDDVQLDAPTAADGAALGVFPKRARDSSTSELTATLGVVVTTN